MFCKFYFLNWATVVIVITVTFYKHLILLSIILFDYFTAYRLTERCNILSWEYKFILEIHFFLLEIQE